MEKNRIFIALRDFDYPNLLADYGVNLAKKINREAFLYGLAKVSTYTPPVTMHRTGVESNLTKSMDQLMNNEEKKLSKIHRSLMGIHPQISYSLDVGLLESSIIAKVENGTPHMVLVESNNELSTLHEWFGTYETRLAENIDVPVLVVPEAYNWKTVENILYVMDMDDHKIENIRFLNGVAEELEANITVVVIANEEHSTHENKKYQMTKDVLKNFLGFDALDFHYIQKEASAEIVENLMEKVNADWFAFQHQDRSFFERMLNDYNTKRLILQSNVPVLVF